MAGSEPRKTLLVHSPTALSLRPARDLITNRYLKREVFWAPQVNKKIN